MTRLLTDEERFVLHEVQKAWGPQNAESDVFFTDDGDAAMFIKAADGSLQIGVALTNLGRWHADGTLTLEELREQIAAPAPLSLWDRLRTIVSRFFAARPASVLSALLLLVPLRAAASDPDCSGVDRWPTRMAFGQLKNAGITTSENVDWTETKASRLASEKIGDDLYRQVHHVTFTEKSGKTISVITINDASSAECSMGGVQTFVVSKQLGP